MKDTLAGLLLMVLLLGAAGCDRSQSGSTGSARGAPVMIVVAPPRGLTDDLCEPFARRLLSKVECTVSLDAGALSAMRSPGSSESTIRVPFDKLPKGEHQAEITMSLDGAPLCEFTAPIVCTSPQPAGGIRVECPCTVESYYDALKGTLSTARTFQPKDLRSLLNDTYCSGDFRVGYGGFIDMKWILTPGLTSMNLDQIVFAFANPSLFAVDFTEDAETATVPLVLSADGEEARFKVKLRRIPQFATFQKSFLAEYDTSLLREAHKEEFLAKLREVHGAYAQEVEKYKRSVFGLCLKDVGLSEDLYDLKRQEFHLPLLQLAIRKIYGQGEFVGWIRDYDPAVVVVNPSGYDDYVVRCDVETADRLIRAANKEGGLDFEILYRAVGPVNAGARNRLTRIELLGARLTVPEELAALRTRPS